MALYHKRRDIAALVLGEAGLAPTDCRTIRLDGEDRGTMTNGRDPTSNRTIGLQGEVIAAGAG